MIPTSQTPIHVIDTTPDPPILFNRKRHLLLDELYELIGVYLERHKVGQPTDLTIRAIEGAMMDFTLQGPSKSRGPGLSKFRECLRDSGFTIEQLINRLKLPRSSFYRFLAGDQKRLISDTVDRLCEGIKKTPEDMGLIREMAKNGISAYYIEAKAPLAV